MKKTKKIIALLLCVVMLFSLGSVAMAANTDTIHYVALGDSTTVGFWLADYTYSHQHNGKYPVSGKYSVYTLFMDYLTKNYSNVTGRDLTITGMRSLYLRGILDADEYAKIVNREKSIFDTGFASHIGTINGGDFDQGGEYVNQDAADALGIINAYNGMTGNEDSMRETFTKELKNANVISYDMFLIDTSINTLATFSKLSSTTPTHKFADLMKYENCPEIIPGADALRNTLQSYLSNAGISSKVANGLVFVNNIIDTLLFSYADLAISFSKNMEWIYTNNNNNPTVLVVMPPNLFPNVDAKIGGITINVTRLINLLLDAVNTYLIKGDPHADRYTLVDCSDASETCIAAYGQDVFNEAHEEFPDYAMLWYSTDAAFIEPKLAQLEEPVTFGDLTPAEQAKIKSNYAAACDFVYNPNNRLVLDLTDIGSTFAGNPNNVLFDGIDRNFYKDETHTELINYAKDNNPVTDADKCAMVIDLGDMLLMAIHPSAKCCVAKVKDIEEAFKSGKPANSYYRVTLTNFFVNLLDAIKGNEASKVAVINTLKKWFTPIISFSLDIMKVFKTN